MLYVTEATRRALRVEKERTPVRKLNRDRRAHIVNVMADIMRHAEPTPFAFEGLFRHRIRAALCLKGWTWREADAAAKDVVAGALRQARAVRPTWKQGQPEFTQEGHVPVERTRCIRCNRPLEGHQRTYCGRLCAGAHRVRIARLMEAEDAAAYDNMARGAKSWWQFHETRQS